MLTARLRASVSSVTALFAFLLMAAPALYGAEAPVTPRLRALWVKPAETADGLDAMLRSATTAGFNALIVDIGHAYGFAAAERDDALDRLIDRAHAAGLRVHVAVNVLQAVAPDEIPASRDHVLYTHPEWLMVPRLLASELLHVHLRSPEYFGALLRSGRDTATPVTLSPLQAPVAAVIVDAISHIAARYPVDGIHLLDLSLPDRDFDYSLAAVEEFTADVSRTLAPAIRQALEARRTIDPFAYPAALPNDWLEFRVRRVTALLERLRTAIRRHRPDALVSTTILPGDDAATTHAQDWRGWVSSGLVDAVSATFEDTGTLSEQILAVTTAAAPSPVWVGIGAARLSSRDAIDRAGAAGRSGAAGILFSYDGLLGPSQDGDVLDEIGRSVFRMPREDQ